MQFSVTEHFRSAEAGQLQSLPGVFFFYDLSPIKVGSSSHFLHKQVPYIKNFHSAENINDASFLLSFKYDVFR